LQSDALAFVPTRFRKILNATSLSFSLNLLDSTHAVMIRSIYPVNPTAPAQKIRLRLKPAPVEAARPKCMSAGTVTGAAALTGMAMWGAD
jgi:hypothetical protein